jgi:hypothetical protein
MPKNNILKYIHTLILFPKKYKVVTEWKSDVFARANGTVHKNRKKILPFLSNHHRNVVDVGKSFFSLASMLLSY